ncbi:COMM domain-containing protein [Entamoeba marina]
MKFKFCGGLSVPDWLLKEIGTLQQLDVNEVQLICEQIIENVIDNTEFDTNTLNNICLRVHFNESDLRAVVTALRFIICSSTQYDIDCETLLQEELEIGIDIDIAQIISILFGMNKERLQRVLEMKTLKLPHVINGDNIPFEILTKDEITNEIIDTKVLLNIQTSFNSLELQLSPEQIDSLIIEMQTAINMMKKGFN